LNFNNNQTISYKIWKKFIDMIYSVHEAMAMADEDQSEINYDEEEEVRLE
jgi:hypothetical protein